MLHFLAWIFFGLVVGLIARLLVPGGQRMGWIATILLGIVGSFAGGFLVSLFRPEADPMQPQNLIMSVIGAVLILVLAAALAKRK